MLAALTHPSHDMGRRRRRRPGREGSRGRRKETDSESEEVRKIDR